MPPTGRPGQGNSNKVSGNLGSMLQNAFALNQAGRLEDAGKAASAILKVFPREANALYLLGIVAHQQGDAKKAVQWFEKSHKADRNNPAAISGLGIVRLDQGRYREAARYFEQVLKSMPKDAATHNNMALACERSGQIDKALDHYGKAVALAPGYGVARLSLVQALIRLERKDAAKKLLRDGLALNPNDGAFHAELAHLHRAAGRLDDAVFHYGKAVELDPRNPQRLIDKAAALVETGRNDEAEACLDAALKLDPGNLVALLDLAEIDASSKQGASKQRAGALTAEAAAIADNAGLETIHSPGLLHRLGRAFDRMKRHDDAFACWDRAHQAWQQELEGLGIAYSETATDADVSRTIAWFDAHRAPVRHALSETRKPVFIIGMMRSGTSLLEQILASHSAVEGAGELLTVTGIAARLGSGGGHSGGDTGGHWTQAPALTDPDALAALAREYLQAIEEKFPDAPYVVDKMPANYQYAGLIRIMFPSAMIIHIRRNPIDTCLSIYMQKFANAYAFAHDLRQIGHNYRAYRRLMRFWQDWDSDLLTVDYEALTGDMPAQVRPVIGKLGLAWEDALERFHETERTVGTASRLQVRQPLYATAVDRWRRYEAHLVPLIDALGEDAAPEGSA